MRTHLGRRDSSELDSKDVLNLFAALMMRRLLLFFLCFCWLLTWPMQQPPQDGSMPQAPFLVFSPLAPCLPPDIKSIKAMIKLLNHPTISVIWASKQSTNITTRMQPNKQTKTCSRSILLASWSPSIRCSPSLCRSTTSNKQPNRSPYLLAPPQTNSYHHNFLAFSVPQPNNQVHRSQCTMG